MGEQITISKEEYDRMMSQLNNQTKMFELLESMRQEVAEMKEQMNIFSMHFGRMYASQSIEETLKAMGDLGKYEIKADECDIYSVDAFDTTKLFTVDDTGDRHYLTLDNGNMLKEAIDSHTPVIKGDAEKNNSLIVPLENQQGEVIGLAVAKGKEGGFTQEDIEAFNLKDGKIGNAFRMGLENKALHQKATTDNLTHLMNREGMNSFIKNEALPRIKHNEPVSVILFDIDRFKRFNDTYGHEVGDECLKKVADTLKANVRQSSDSGVFRWGGEEMVVILPVDENKAAEIAARLGNAIENNPLQVNGHDVPVTVSGGIAKFETNLSYGIDKDNILAEFDKIFEKADTALYFAKENGRNQICQAENIKPDLFKSVNLTEDIVASENPQNIWLPKENDQIIAYSGITSESYPDIVDTLMNRAEASPYNFDRLEQFKALGGDIVINIVAEKDKGLYAELELKNYGNIITAPLTSDEQTVLQSELECFMQKNNIKIPEFLNKAEISEQALEDAVYEETKDEITAELNEMKEMNDKLFDMPQGVLLKDVDRDYEGDAPEERIERMLTFKVGEYEGKDLLADMYAGQNKETGQNIVYNIDGDKAYIDGDKDKLFNIPSDVIRDTEEISDMYITLAANAEKELGEDWHKVADIDADTITDAINIKDLGEMFNLNTDTAEKVYRQLQNSGVITKNGKIDTDKLNEYMDKNTIKPDDKEIGE